MRCQRAADAISMPCHADTPCLLHAAGAAYYAAFHATPPDAFIHMMPMPRYASRRRHAIYASLIFSFTLMPFILLLPRCAAAPDARMPCHIVVICADMSVLAQCARREALCQRVRERDIRAMMHAPRVASAEYEGALPDC